MLIFIGSEVMLFAGLMSAFLVLRARLPEWPPPGQPRFPVGITALNTLVLLASGWTVSRAWRAARGGAGARAEAQVERWLGITAGLGLLFVLVQGIEWTRLIGHGLQISPGIYGGIFSTVIGMHGLHVLCGVGAVVGAWFMVWQGRLMDRMEPVITAVSLFWFFVVAVWPVLYVLVYLW
jgi:heme/copper-type cytochrome/quinol oxidase subunit 3